MPVAVNNKLKLKSLLSLVFFFSGFAALMYQVAWQRLLTVYYGVGAVSITLIVSVYMFGLGAGALFGGYLAERTKKKILLYFYVEFLLGCFGLVSLPFIKFLGQNTAGSSYLVSLGYMFLYLSIPTFLMGITLPLLTKIFNQLVRNFLNTVSFLYFINTIGAAVGSAFASYVVISFFGLDNAIYVAVTINFVLAFLIFLARSMPSSCEDKGVVNEARLDHDSVFGKIAFLLVFITGFVAIGYEIVWFRIVGVLVKASPYAFSSVLIVYLSGIGLGSYGMNQYIQKKNIVDKKSFFFLLQFLIGIYVVVVTAGYYYLTDNTFLNIFSRISFSSTLHPSPEIFSGGNVSFKSLFRLVDVFFWSAVFMFIPTVFMGASFPLISSLALSRDNREGETIGVIYFFNIFGNVLGGIVTGFVLLPLWGTELTLIIFSSIGLLMGFFVVTYSGKALLKLPKTAFIVLLLLFTVFLFPKDGQLYETMHNAPAEQFDSYLEEGVDGIYLAYQYGDKIRNFINGLSHGGRPGYIYYFETIESLSFAESTDNILIIGYGTGSIVEAVLKLPDVKKVTIVELSSSLIKNLKKMTLFEEMLSDSRIELVIDDGRRFLLRSNEKFDLILMDPLRTTTSYSNNLYSRQFFNLAKQHLSDRGVLMVGIEPYPPCGKIIHKTVLSVFDNVRAYNFFSIASKSEFIRNEQLHKRLMDNYPPDQQKLILETNVKYLGGPAYIKKAGKKYPVNEDWKPNCEYYLGLILK